MSEHDTAIVEAVARAIYDAPNGIDGDQVADMILMDDRINGANAEECRAQVMAVCREAARAAIAAHEAALAAARTEGRLGFPVGSGGTESMTEWQPAETAPNDRRVRIKWKTGQIHIAMREDGIWRIEAYVPKDCSPPPVDVDDPDFWAPLE